VLPYARQHIDEEDIAAVVEVLRSSRLTTGPRVEAFERAVAEIAGTAHAVAVSSGTAALHTAMAALSISEGDEVIVPAMTFAATANAVVYAGGTPIFADVDADTLLLDPERVASLVTPCTRAVIAVDYAGQPCDYDALRAVTDRHDLALVADGCHALGGAYQGRPVGGLADLTTFSFHPVKPITTGEGGMITTDNDAFCRRMRQFRNHGMSADHDQRRRDGSWIYEITELGYNYRITDMQCALGLRQLDKLPGWVTRRQAIARQYDAAFADLAGVESLRVRDDVSHAWHLYVVRVDADGGRLDRATVFAALRDQGIGVNVHYIPVHLHPFYLDRFGTGPGMCPVAEAAYERIVSLPIFPAMTDDDVDRVVAAVWKAAG
jgi:perosamine synthetase